MKPRLWALAGCCALLLGGGAAAQAQVSPEAAQIAGLRKELQRQRKAHDAAKKELRAAQTTIGELDRKVEAQDDALDSLRWELTRTWAWGGAGAAVLLLVLVIIAMRRPPTPSRSDELQQRLAALDNKLRELSPRK